MIIIKVSLQTCLSQKALASTIKQKPADPYADSYKQENHQIDEMLCVACFVPCYRRRQVIQMIQAIHVHVKR